MTAEDKAVLTQALDALRDLHGGWKYIRSFHGDLYGVGWDRAQDKVEDAIAGVEALLTKPVMMPVASIHKNHLRDPSGNWCREVLLYSAPNTGDSPEKRVVTLYADVEAPHDPQRTVVGYAVYYHGIENMKMIWPPFKTQEQAIDLASQIIGETKVVAIYADAVA